MGVDAAGRRWGQATDLYSPLPLARKIKNRVACYGGVEMISRASTTALGIDVDRIGPVAVAARSAVADGVLGYVLLVAQKPAER